MFSIMFGIMFIYDSFVLLRFIIVTTHWPPKLNWPNDMVPQPPSFDSFDGASCW